jgi:hypothetical protein
MTVAEVLRQSGLSEEAIAALDAKAMSAFSGILTTADQAKAEALQKEKAASELAVKAEADRKAQEIATEAAKAAQDAAELSNRTVKEFWDNTYNPGVAAWEKERNELAKKASDALAETAYYKAQREGYLGTLGIKPEDAPVFTPPANTAPPPDPNKTPGTPTFVDPKVVISRVGDGMNTINDIMYKHQVLYGRPLPIPPSQLIAQADALKLSPMEYATRTYKFAEKEQEQRAAEAKKHDDEIAAAAVAAKETEWKTKMDAQSAEFAAKERLRAEQAGSNPDTKLPPGSAKFTDLKRAVAAGERPDPTKMSTNERRQLTLNNIHKAIEEREAVVA